MEQLSNGFTLELCNGAFPLSTDSIALADFVKLPKQASVLDLGAGCGTLGLLLCAKDPGCLVTGIELDPNAHTTALRNSSANALEHRLTSICADLKTFADFIKPGSFTCCVSNPPYFSGGPESKACPAARRDDHCTTADLMAAAAWSLKYGGDLFLVHRPEKLGEMIACAGQKGLEAKRLRLLRHKKNGPVTLVLVQFRKGGKPGLCWEEVFLHDGSGAPSEYYRNLYHL